MFLSYSLLSLAHSASLLHHPLRTHFSSDRRHDAQEFPRFVFGPLVMRCITVQVVGVRKTVVMVVVVVLEHES